MFCGECDCRIYGDVIGCDLVVLLEFECVLVFIWYVDVEGVCFVGVEGVGIILNFVVLVVF